MTSKRFWLALILCLTLATPYCAAFAQTLTVQSFPTNYLDMRDELADRPYEHYSAGLFEETVTVSETVTRTLKSYLPEGSIQNCKGLFIAIPSGVDAAEFLETSGFRAIADAEKFIVFLLEAGEGGWDLENADNEIAYIKRAYSLAGSKTNYVLTSGGRYFMGYGDGATIMMKYLLNNPYEPAGAAVFGALDIDEAYLEQFKTKPSGDPTRTLSEVELPLWITVPEKDAAVQTVIDYWKEANDCAGPANRNDFATEIYAPTDIQPRPLTDNDVTLAKLYVTEGEEGYGNQALNSAVWDSIKGISRYKALYGKALRAATTPAQANMEVVEFELDGLKRYYALYIPTAVRNNPEKAVPLVVSAHGSSQVAESFLEQTEWYEVAEQNSFIVAVGTGYMNKGTEKSIPIITWNASRTEGLADDAAYIKAIVDQVSEKYAVDAGRVYMHGFSNGAQLTNMVGVYLPDTFAALAVVSVVTDIEATFPAEDVAAAQAYEMPIIISTGTADAYDWMHQEAWANMLNYYRIRNRCVNHYDTALCHTTDSVYFHQLLVNEKGVPMVDCVYVENKAHQTFPSESYLHWDFMSKYARAADGSILYMGEENPYQDVSMGN